MRWDGWVSAHLLLMLLIVIHPLFMSNYSRMHKVGFKGSWRELMSVKAQKKMTLPAHQGQGWWQGGRVNLSWRGWGQSETKDSQDRMHIDNGPMTVGQCVSQGPLSGGKTLSMLTSVPKHNIIPLYLKFIVSSLCINKAPLRLFALSAVWLELQICHFVLINWLFSYLTNRPK